MDVDAEGVAGPATEEFDEAILSAADFELNSAARAKAVGANALEVETAELELVAGRCKPDQGAGAGAVMLAVGAAVGPVAAAALARVPTILVTVTRGRNESWIESRIES